MLLTPVRRDHRKEKIRKMKNTPSVQKQSTPNTKQSAQASYRRTFSIVLACGVILLIAVMLMGNSLQSGQGGDDALFIDTNGNVGIGTDEPQAKLTVNGRIKDMTGFVTPVGAILPYAGSRAPEGWLLCDGKSYRAEDYAELYRVIKNSYGSQNNDTFRVPDLRGRGLMGLSGSGNFAQLGQIGGAETHPLTVQEIPAHTHAVNDPGHHHAFRRPRGDQNWNNGDKNTWWGQRDENVPTAEAKTNISIQPAGGGVPHPILDPYVTVNFIIKF